MLHEQFMYTSLLKIFLSPKNLQGFLAQIIASLVAIALWNMYVAPCFPLCVADDLPCVSLKLPSALQTDCDLIANPLKLLGT